MRITKPFHSRNVRSIVRLAPVRLQSAPNLVVSCVAATATPDLLLLSLTNIHNKLWYHIGLCHPARIFLNRLHEAEIYEPSGILWKELRTKRKPLLCLDTPVDFNRQTEGDLQETWARLTRQWRQQQQWPVVLGGRYGHSRPPIWSDTAPRPQSQQQWRCVAYILQSSHKLSSVSENKISSKNSQYLKIKKKEFDFKRTSFHIITITLMTQPEQIVCLKSLQMKYSWRYVLRFFPEIFLKVVFEVLHGMSFLYHFSLQSVYDIIVSVPGCHPAVRTALHCPTLPGCS